MSELQLIEVTLARVARRRRINTALHRMWQGLAMGAVVSLVLTGVYHFYPLPEFVLILVPVLPAAAMVIGFAGGMLRKAGLLPVARWVDQRLHLHERFATALELASQPQAGNWRELVIADAAARANALDLKKVAPFHLPGIARWGLLLVTIAAGLGFVPEHRSREHLRRQADRENIKEVGRRLTELTRRNLDERPPALTPTENVMEAAIDLGEKLSRTTLERKDALQQLSKTSEAVKQELNQLDSPALKRLEQAARSGGANGNESPATLQKQIETLQKQIGAAEGGPEPLEKLRSQLAKLQQTAQELANDSSPGSEKGRQQLADSLSALSHQMQGIGIQMPQIDAAIEALMAAKPELLLKDLEAALNDLDKLRQLAKSIEQLQQRMEKLGRDLAEQLQNGQTEAARETLEKMVSQLQSANLTPDQMQKIMSEVSKALPAASLYGKVAEHLGAGARQLQAGTAAPAAQSLAAAAKELEKLLQQLADSQTLLAELQALDQASMCIGTGKGWCAGKKGGYNPSGKGPGSGVGTWADEGGDWNGQLNDRWDNSGIDRPDLAPRGHTDRPEGTSDGLKPTKVPGQFSPGGQMPSVTLKGVSLKGQSKVDYQEAVSAAQSEAQSALSQDKVPQAYRRAVKDYFSDLSK